MVTKTQVPQAIVFQWPATPHTTKDDRLRYTSIDATSTVDLCPSITTIPLSVT
jgi:hypothetical protein